MIRKPIAAGRFYPARREELMKDFAKCFQPPLGPGPISAQKPREPGALVGLMVPHAGWQFSGYAAAWAYTRLAMNGPLDTAILIGPAHGDPGINFALATDYTYETPLGRVVTNEDMCKVIKKRATQVIDIPGAHTNEHSLEVQLPFLQVISPETRIVPMLVGWLRYDKLQQEALDRVAECIAEVVIGTPSTLVVATTDLMHYVTRESAMEKDERVLELIQAQDADTLIKRVIDEQISMCGLFPVALLLKVMKHLSVPNTEILSHYTSGDVPGGDPSYVVGYASAAFSRD